MKVHPHSHLSTWIIFYLGSSIVELNDQITLTSSSSLKLTTKNLRRWVQARNPECRIVKTIAANFYKLN